MLLRLFSSYCSLLKDDSQFNLHFIGDANSGPVSNKTEFLNTNFKFSDGPDLPIPTTYHELTKLQGNLVFLTGGGSHFNDNVQTWFVNYKEINLDENI